MTDPYWWVTPVVTVASIYVSARMITWQQKASKANELKFKLFEDLGKTTGEASAAMNKVGISAMGMPGAMQICRNMAVNGQTSAVPTFRIPSFNEMHFVALQRVTELLILLENYDIVSEHFFLFRRALSCSHQDVMSAYALLSPLLYRVLPIDLPGKADTWIPTPTDDDVRDFAAQCNAYWLATHRVIGYIHDIRIEAQNVLLGGLFSRRVPPRQPADPRIWVLRTDDPDYLERLKKYFLEDHPVAVRNGQLESEAFDKAMRAMEEEK